MSSTDVNQILGTIENIFVIRCNHSNVLEAQYFKSSSSSFWSSVRRNVRGWWQPYITKTMFVMMIRCWWQKCGFRTTKAEVPLQRRNHFITFEIEFHIFCILNVKWVNIAVGEHPFIGDSILTFDDGISNIVMDYFILSGWNQTSILNECLWTNVLDECSACYESANGGYWFTCNLRWWKNASQRELRCVR